ncbi:MAG: methyl-accepting chemotaxis protein [Gemmatimonadota bacterium]|nr:methyl-accepting chemotaxis protein [Gemmatimonadota bacterium]
MPSTLAPPPLSAGSAPRAVQPRATLSMRLVPWAAVAAALIVVPLGALANRRVAASLRAQSDARLESAARRYAALAQAALASHPDATGDPSADSTLAPLLRGMFATESVSRIGVELTDSAGRPLVMSRDAATGDAGVFGAAAQVGGDTVFAIATSRGPERAAVATANLGRWIVVAHETDADADAAYRDVRAGLIGVEIGLFLIVIGVGVAVDRLVNDRIRRPAMELAAVAEAVAGGDLTVHVPAVRSTDEIERVGRALATMVNELARLARALNTSAGDTATMSAEITASSEQMSGSAAQIAQTASDLSRQSTEMAESIQTLAASATTLAPVAERMSAGAHEGVARNERLRDLARANRDRLDASAAALATLTGDVEATTTTVRALVEASQEIRTFVALVHSLARHSKLLALNAAMEAARAGDQGEGFSVVAAEVRRLSAMSSDAAERTQRVVGEVLGGVERSSQNMERIVSTARDVRRATELASASFVQLEGNVAELESWTASIETAATSANGLVVSMTARLDAIARGTEAFAAAMQEVAAASEQQSASTEQIAAAAASMAHAAERLAKLVANLRIADARRSGGERRAEG